jgi:F-type H+-transporting ATPase subunit b
MKKILFVLFFTIPLVLFASDTHVQSDILQRSVNFIIFIAIMYYLLADKLKDFFSNRTKSIQAELEKVQDTLKESKDKVNNAQNELNNAKKLASEIVENANADIENIQASIQKTLEHDINYLNKGFDDKLKAQTQKMKQKVISEILNDVLKSENIALSQNELANIILKKVA